MRRSRAATSRAGGAGAASVSLFPFLAVLICTMGALILLLVVIARHARLQAAQSAPADSTDRQHELQAERELVQWRVEQLKASRAATERRLADARLKLGQIEDHTRQLQQKLVALKAAWADLDSAADGGAASRQELERQLADLEALQTRARQELADAQKEAAERQASFAVVPYEGPHETHRQPIYIECREDSIVLQPEGIVLTESDFAGPLGPGNPLDVALRARREYLLNQGQIKPDGDPADPAGGEPYPLLLVRPRGIAAYYVARAAMQSWASEFGYELIGEDWKLAFPPADPRLAEEISRAVDVARVRQARLAEAVPFLTHAQPRPKYRAAPYRGGTMLDSGGAPGGGRGGFTGSSPGGVSRRSPSYAGRGSAGWSPEPRSDAAGGTGSDRLAGGPAGGDRQSPSGRYGTAAPTSTATAQPGEAAMAGRSTHQQVAPQGEDQTVRRPGEWVPRDLTHAKSGQSGDPTCTQVRPLAEKRGADWGLPNSAQGSVPITRPIRVDCLRDRLVIVPGRGLAAAKEIPLGQSTEEAIDELVSSVWTVMDGWGIAGKAMYWRPVLSVHVAPDAQGRFAELETLLDGSGLDVRRKDGP